jgi:predicted  nucleic acid-binding Zn-ribbon protein
MHTNLFNSKRNKEPTWEDLLDRESKEKDYKRDKRENVIPMPTKKHSDSQKDEGKNRKIVDLQKEFEELKSKIRHVENKNERMLTHLKTYHPDD